MASSCRKDGGKDVFVHITAVQAAGLKGLNDGQNVSYDVVMERGKAAATNLKLLCTLLRLHALLEGAVRRGSS